MPVDLSFKDMTAAERRREIAAILAEGVRRLKRTATSPTGSLSENVPATAATCLEVGGETRLTGRTG